MSLISNWHNYRIFVKPLKRLGRNLTESASVQDVDGMDFRALVPATVSMSVM